MPQTITLVPLKGRWETAEEKHSKMLFPADFLKSGKMGQQECYQDKVGWDKGDMDCVTGQKG